MLGHINSNGKRFGEHRLHGLHSLVGVLDRDGLNSHPGVVASVLDGPRARESRQAVLAALVLVIGFCCANKPRIT